MIDYLAPYKLLKEARESWDYIFTDKLVYAIQDRDVVNRGRYCGYLQAYLKREVWLTICIRVSHLSGQIRDYFWLIESLVEPDANRALGRHDDLGSRFRLDDKSMTGLIGQFSEDREQVCFRPIRSIIRLHPLNFWKGSRQDVDTLKSTTFPVIFRSIADGELSQFMGFTTRSDISHMPDRQFPSHIIQGSPETAGEIRNDRSPRIRNGGRPTEALPSIFIFLGDSLEDCGALIKLGDSSLEVAEVYLRPITLEPSIMQGMRNWNHE